MKLFFRKTGEGSPLVILHGLFGISDNWAALAKRWAEHFTVYTVDLRNHGQSPHSSDWNYHVMAEDIVEFIADEKLLDITLLGHSMGGKVSMHLANEYPNAISKLIVCDISPREYPVHNRNVVHALESVQLDQCKSRKDAEQYLRQTLHEEGTIQFLLKNLFWKETESGEKELAWRFNLEVISSHLDEVYKPTVPDFRQEIPSLFLRGERSDYVNADDEKLIREIFHGAEIITIPEAGHWIHADNSEAVFNEVLRFSGR
jgi:pimeloyl-ACP methyl ester carboxylesterase